VGDSIPDRDIAGLLQNLVRRASANGADRGLSSKRIGRYCDARLWTTIT
jgi:hypothetical protein